MTVHLVNRPLGLGEATELAIRHGRIGGGGAPASLRALTDDVPWERMPGGVRELALGDGSRLVLRELAGGMWELSFDAGDIAGGETVRRAAVGVGGAFAVVALVLLAWLAWRAAR